MQDYHRRCCYTFIMRAAIVATLLQKCFNWCFKKPLDTTPISFVLIVPLSDLILLLLLLLLPWPEQLTFIAAFTAVCQCDNSTLASPAHYWLRQKAPIPLLSFLKSCHFTRLWQGTFCTAITVPSLSANLLETLIELAHSIVPHYHVLSQKRLHIQHMAVFSFHLVPWQQFQ